MVAEISVSLSPCSDNDELHDTYIDCIKAYLVAAWCNGSRAHWSANPKELGLNPSQR